jgi:phosphoglycerate dehydrogenase-like enzyme
MDTEALIAEAGRLRFALDVVDPEPLPAESALWDAPGVTIAPHVGGANDSAPVRYDRLISTQLSHLAAGEPYENIVWGPLA